MPIMAVISIKAELKAQGKQQEDDTDIGPCADILYIRYGREQGKMWPYEQPGKYVPQHNRLSQPLEYKRSSTGYYQYERKIVYKIR
jgi:hypothetical protein